MDTLNKVENQSEDNQAKHRNRKMADHENIIESAILLTIFPKEVWMLIFHKIFQPKDLHNLQVSSGFFHILLGALKTKILFPEVIKVFANSPINKFGAHGKITNHLLNCRLVCRTWQIGVDAALQSFSNPSKLLDVPCDTDPNVSFLSSDVHFSLQEEPMGFLQQFEGEYATENRNPFIGRGLCIFFSDQITDFESFIQPLHQILTIYGHQIWSFGMYLESFRPPSDPSPSWFLEHLRDFLQLMPNLKVLKLEYHRINFNDDWKALELSLESCVFPDLKDLRFLQSDNLPTPVFDAMLHKYSHVKMLSSFPVMGSSDMSMFTQNLPNLTQIAFSMRELNKLIQWDNSNALWPLKTLIIRLEYFEVDWQALFQYLENRWAATLTELNLDFLFVHFHDDHPTQVLPPLNLPNLKVFAFSSQVLVPLDFILPMRNSLERLVVRYWQNPRRPVVLESELEHEQEIQFFRFRKNLKGSNIWSLFPNLNTIEQYDRFSLEQLSRRPVSIM